MSYGTMIKHLETLITNFQGATSLNEMGFAGLGRTVTDVLYVSVHGDNSTGKTWATAYNEIQDALDAASTDANKLTLINIAPKTGSEWYDINRTGDPTWSGNYVLNGSYRTWTKIKNTHASATSIMKFTGLVALNYLNINLGNGSGNGIIFGKSAFRAYSCQFVGEDLTGAATALELNGTGLVKHGKIVDCHFHGHVTHMTAMKLDGCLRSLFVANIIGECLNGVHIVNEASDNNSFWHLDVKNCALGLDIDEGNAQYFEDVHFHNNTRNVDDEVGDHLWGRVISESNIVVVPDNFTGIAVATHANPNEWGNDIEIRAAVAADNPFKVVAVHVEANASEKFRIKLSADSGTTWYDDVLIEGVVNDVKRSASTFSSETEFLFNKGTRISASSKSESGANSATIWVETQEI